jgi:hypothetical protein
MATFTLVHVLLSLVGIATGFVVVFGLITAKQLDRWTAAFFFDHGSYQLDRISVSVS